MEIAIGAVNIIIACLFFALIVEFFIEIYIFNADDWTNIGMIFIFWLTFLPVAAVNPFWILPLAGKRLNAFSIAAYLAELHLWLLIIIFAFIF